MNSILKHYKIKEKGKIMQIANSEEIQWSNKKKMSAKGLIQREQCVFICWLELFCKQIIIHFKAPTKNPCDRFVCRWKLGMILLHAGINYCLSIPNIFVKYSQYLFPKK